jgi:DNA-binding transcriptional LysR family regulator
VHQQVKKLEAELGVSLFERVGKDGVRLSAAGKRLFEFVGPFFDGLPGVVRGLQGGDYAGALCIHAAPLFLRKLLPPWIARLRAVRPEVTIDLREMTEPDLALLRQGEADLLVDHLPQIPDDIATLEVATLEVATLSAFVVLPAGHAEAKRKRPRLAELRDNTFVGYSPNTHAARLQHGVLAAHGIVPRHTISAGSVETILGFVQAGLGWSIVPDLSPKGPEGEGLVATPLEPEARFSVVAAWRKDTPENPLLDAVLETAPKP